MSNLARILAIGVLAVVALALGWVAFLELFIAGFRPVVVDHGVGRAMLATEVWKHAIVGAALAGASILLVILGLRLANSARRTTTPNSGLQPTRPAAFLPSRLCHHSVAGRAVSPGPLGRPMPTSALAWLDCYRATMVVSEELARPRRLVIAYATQQAYMEFPQLIKAALELGVIPALALFLVGAMFIQNRQLIRDRRATEEQLLKVLTQVLADYQKLLSRINRSDKSRP